MTGPNSILLGPGPVCFFTHALLSIDKKPHARNVNQTDMLVVMTHIANETLRQRYRGPTSDRGEDAVTPQTRGTGGGTTSTIALKLWTPAIGCGRCTHHPSYERREWNWKV